MAEPFKNLLNRNVIEGMASHFSKNSSNFDKKSFIYDATKDLDSLELKARTERITDTMIKYFPADFEKAGEIMLASLGPPLEDDVSAGAVDDKGISGWAITALTRYVGLHGHEYFDLSMELFREMTTRLTSEFDIRFFLLKSPQKTLVVLNGWATDENQYVRRLVSEGSRPRLPWAMRLPEYIIDPSPVIGLLEQLKDDDKELVRRSVANNLNDISKDHPDIVAGIAEKWMVNASNERIKLIRHACRTLIKSGHKKTLAVLGYKPPSIKETNIEIQTSEVIFGEALEFTLSIESISNQEQPLMIDYVIHHQKANGKTSPKVFKWRIANLVKNKTLNLAKKHAIKKITTRKYYAGLHSVEVMVNGISVGKSDFYLLM